VHDSVITIQRSTHKSGSCFHLHPLLPVPPPLLCR
jgi:hypothetical protein